MGCIAYHSNIKAWMGLGTILYTACVSVLRVRDRGFESMVESN